MSRQISNKSLFQERVDIGIADNPSDLTVVEETADYVVRLVFCEKSDIGLHSRTAECVDAKFTLPIRFSRRPVSPPLGGNPPRGNLSSKNWPI